MKMEKNLSLKLQNVAYHLGLVSKNLNEALAALGVESGTKAAEETATPPKGKKGAKATKAEEPEEEMEEVESQFSDDPADFEDEPEVEEKPVKGKKGAKAPKKEEPADDDNFDFDEAEVVDDEPALTEADVRTAMTNYAKKHTKEKALAILGKFAKSKKVTDVPPAKFAALVDALKVK